MTFVALGAMAQVSKDGYFITNDGTRYDGVTIENPDYADACERVMISVRGDGGRFYYPRDIASYGTDFGYRYVSSTVMLNGDTARVFLKELVRDSDISLTRRRADMCPSMMMARLTAASSGNGPKTVHCWMNSTSSRSR